MINFLTPAQRAMLEATFYNLYRGSNRDAECPEVLAAISGMNDKELEQATNAVIRGTWQLAVAS